LISQSYGAGNLKQCGIILNRGRIIALIAFIPIILLLIMSERFLLAIGMDPVASSYAGTYV
jgi:Na+-driven multidrug efflux pump